IFDSQPTLSIGAIALDTTLSPPAVYVATGEGDDSADSYYGMGIFVSFDLGVTWTQLGAAEFSGQAIGSIAIDTTQNPRVIYAAVTFGSSETGSGNGFLESGFSGFGLWRSGDGGNTWAQYAPQTFGKCPLFTNQNCPAQSVVIDPSNPARVYVS